MQKRNQGNIPKRTRFYQALIDAAMLKSGERGFDNLKPAYIIVICGFDQYGYGLYRSLLRIGVKSTLQKEEKNDTKEMTIW